jgi:ATP-dependent exoDNAse (exonuclease V) alpha subunit
MKNSSNVTLTEHQQNIFDQLTQDISKALESRTPFIGVLDGPAGTGKTVMTGVIVKYLLETYQFKRMRCATPTHKSLKVLKDNIGNVVQGNRGLSTSTLHSFLKLKIKQNETKIEFVEDLFDKSKAPPVKILLVDECSMVSQDLLGHIEKRMRVDGIEIVLFIGDGIQLPPVDSETTISPVFRLDQITKYHLTEVVRQASQSYTLKKATELRKCIETNTYEDITFESIEDIVVYTDPKTWVDHYVEFADKDTTVITAYTNNSINKYNKYVRNLVNSDMEKPLPKLLDQEYVVMQEAYEDNGKFVNNGEIIQVVNPIKMYDSILDLDYWTIYYTDSEFKDEINPENTEAVSIKIQILDDTAIETCSNHLKHLAAVATNHKLNGNHNEAKATWKKYWSLKNRFADVKYPYAYTVHKTQGSTFEEIYINYRDINNCTKDYEMLYRLMYVALTRAKTKVHILV